MAGQSSGAGGAIGFGGSPSFGGGGVAGSAAGANGVAGSAVAGSAGSASPSAGAGGSTGGTVGSGGTSTGGSGDGGKNASGGPGSGGTSTAGRGGSGGQGGASAGSGTGGSGGSPLAPVTDYAAPGPFKSMKQSGTGPDGTYTIFRPETLGANGFLHAPIIFGPGTGMEVDQMSGFLQRFVSHGFVVIARKLEGGPRSAETRRRLTAGLDWIIAQNSVAGSVFQGKLDVRRAVAMGYSVGGTGSVEIGGHEAIATVVSIHGHQAEGDLDVPLLLTGGTNDVQNGVSWQAPTYEASQTQTFFSLVQGADHGYIQGTVNGVPGGVETPAIVAWLRYWIYNDQGGKRYFYGDDCVMCMSPWTQPQRKNWQ